MYTIQSFSIVILNNFIDMPDKLIKLQNIVILMNYISRSFTAFTNNRTNN